jgi:hypothetical protein
MNTMGNRIEIMNKTLGRISIIVVPLFFALSELVHPITQDTILGEIQSAKDNDIRWLIAHALALIAIVFLPFLAQKLICYIDDKKVKSSILGLALSYIGIIGVTGLLIYDFILWDAWKVGNDEIVAKYLDILYNSVYGKLFLLIGPIIFLCSFLLLVILMLISEKIAKWKSILIIIGLLIYGLAGPLVPVSNGHILVSSGALIMLAGFIGILMEDISGNKIDN